MMVSCVSGHVLHIVNAILQKTIALLYNSYDEEDRFRTDER